MPTPTPARPPTLVVREVHGRDVVAQLGTRLDDLLDTVDAPIMARRTWLETWIACYRDHEPWAITVEGDDGSLQAVAPLAVRRRAGGFEVVAMGIGATSMIRLSARDQASALALARGVASALAAIGGPWRLSLPHVPTADPVVAELARTLPVALVETGEGAPLMRIGERRELRAYATRSHRQNSRTMRNRLGRAGLVAVVSHLETPDAISAVLAETEAVRRERDQAVGRPVRLDDSRYRAFRRSVLERLAAEGAAEITTLRIGDDLAAYVIGLLDRRTYRMWETRFAPRWESYGVGHLAVEAALERVLEGTRFDEFDFMGGIEAYKMRLATDVVGAEHFAAWSSSSFRAWHQFVQDGRSPSYYKWLFRHLRRRLGGAPSSRRV